MPCKSYGSGRVAILYFSVGRVGLGPRAVGSDWVGSNKSDPWATLNWKPVELLRFVVVVKCHTLTPALLNSDFLLSLRVRVGRGPGPSMVGLDGWAFFQILSHVWVGLGQICVGTVVTYSVFPSHCFHKLLIVLINFIP